MTGAGRSSYDVVIVGGGHNGLTAAAYLARAGRSVLVLERLDHVGGAAVSSAAFPKVGGLLSRYSYLVSLLPQSIIDELGLDLELRSRNVASYTPTFRGGRPVALHVERNEGPTTWQSFRKVAGNDLEYQRWATFYQDVSDFARVVAPSLTKPLVPAREIQDEVKPETWQGIVERPLGEMIERRFKNDLVRGVVATDALIGTFADINDESLIQNKCFLYHLIGNGDGEWKVPVGGMGSVTAALTRAALDAGVEIITGAAVSAINPSADDAEVVWHTGPETFSVRGDYVLSNVAPWTLGILMGNEPKHSEKPVGAQIKINFLLSRLPELKTKDDPRVAFSGTFHVFEEYTHLAYSYDEASSGRIPSFPPGELYCHSLTDPSILGALADKGVHTLTYFGLHMPPALFEDDRDAAREEAVRRVINSIDLHLQEPLLDCVLRGPDGSLCIEAKIPQDIEADLAMPGGHIFHGDLSWPWATNPEALDTPAQRWGVATDHPRVMLCGAGARRGGAVSGLGGHNAAHAILES